MSYYPPPEVTFWWSVEQRLVEHVRIFGHAAIDITQADQLDLKGFAERHHLTITKNTCTYSLRPTAIRNGPEVEFGQKLPSKRRRSKGHSR